MLPVSAWPPGPPGASLSPFGRPRTIRVPSCGYVLPKGAWVVQTGGNQVVMFRPSWQADLYRQPARQMGTGYLPGQTRWTGSGRRASPQPWRAGPLPTTATPVTTGAGAQPKSALTFANNARPSSWSWSGPCKRPTHDQALEAWRAWQRRTGNTDPPIRPLPGRVPPNFAGWRFVGAPSTTLIPFGSGGLVLADGQNVVITGGGCANITQAFSV